MNSRERVILPETVLSAAIQTERKKNVLKQKETENKKKQSYPLSAPPPPLKNTHFLPPK